MKVTLITNLLSNALKYAYESTEPVKVRVFKNDSVIGFTVTDKGMGIAEEHFHKIFDRFERVVGINHISGLGLGLFICRQIIDAHSGKIWVESELGQGATFGVELPATT